MYRPDGGKTISVVRFDHFWWSHGHADTVHSKNSTKMHRRFELWVWDREIDDGRTDGGVAALLNAPPLKAGT